MTDDLFIEMEGCQFTKTGQAACGDDIRLLRINKERRTIAALSDGLGSGVKAHVMATMTTTMALRFLQYNMDTLESVEIIMDSLPVCQTRKISYATFSLFDYRRGGLAKIIEMGNPSYVHLRGTKEVVPEKDKTLVSKHWPDREVRKCEAAIEIGDRIILCSDGVTQSGLGSGGEFKFGWRRSGMLAFAKETISNEPDISAADLARRIACRALNITPGSCKDDISCLVIYFRTPRKMRVLTGPPYYKEHDEDYARQACLGEEHVVIAGGTTANIIERCLGKKVKIDPRALRNAGSLPPAGIIPGVGIVTEGILTLSRVADALETGEPAANLPQAAKKIVEMVGSHDSIEFIVGTKVNETHQDPNVPQDLELRRSIIRRMEKILAVKYRKTVKIDYY